jgi:aryl carrier-like protein
LSSNLVTKLAEPTYDIVLADPHVDSEAILRIWRGHFGPDADHPAKFRHIYLDNPFGAPLILLLRHVESGEYVGAAAAVPRPMILDGRRIDAAVLSHFAVLSAHRSLGPALRLQAGIAEACEGRFDLIYGMPTARAVPVVQRIGYSKIASLKRYVRVLRYGSYAARVLPSWLARPGGWSIDALTITGSRIRRWWPNGLRSTATLHPVSGFDALWEAAPMHSGLASVRTMDFLAWRFSALHGAEVHFLQIRSGATLMAWFACEDGRSKNGRISIIDYWFGGLAADERKRCIRHLVSSVAAAGYAAIELKLSGDRYGSDQWKASGFVERDESPIVAKCYSGSISIGDPGRIHMTYADQDS